MLTEAQTLKDQLIAWRRTLHQWPELGFDLPRTTAQVSDALAAMGVEYRRGVGKSGIVATLGDGNGPVIGVRADMDALPIHEQTGLPFASQTAGKMHACGHDAHTAMLLGVAALLNRHQVPGQVRLLFQPSEEGGYDQGISGAPRMIEDGALNGVDAVIALHVSGVIPTGQIEISSGWMQAAVDNFRGFVLGRGGHGAYPHHTVDPIWLTSQVLAALYAIPSRRIGPTLPCVVTVGKVQGGAADNVIPDVVELLGTLRSFDAGVREQLISDVERAFSLTRSFGGDYRLEIERGYPPLYNDPAAAAWLHDVATAELGAEHVGPAEASMGAEDFAFMAQRAPGAMFKLGVQRPDGPPQYLHTADFNLDEDALPIGTAILAETALRFVRGELAQL
ncbi:MAG: M20 family metallopeptidase [Caldilineales bacterium]